MKIIECDAQNFCSYKDLQIELDGSGLTLLSGMTGSGKSTILDAVCWTLFGVTSKNGNADEVRPWNSKEITQCSISIDTKKGLVVVVRKRGNPTQNDLYYMVDDGAGKEIRGKNLQDTQKMLNEYLGVDSDLFLTASYIHQFSKGDLFFVSKPSERREVFEKIADQSLAIKLGENASDLRKTIKKELEAQIQKQKLLEGRRSQILVNLENLFNLCKDWTEDSWAEIRKLEALMASFDLETTIRVITSSIKHLSEQLINPIDLETELENEINLKSEIKVNSAIYKDAIKQLEIKRTTLNCSGKDACPLCDSEISLADVVNTTEASIALNETNLQQYNLSLKETEQKIENLKRLKKLNDFIENQIAKLHTDLRIAHDKQSSIEEKIENLKKAKNPYENQKDKTEEELNAVTAQKEATTLCADSLQLKLNGLNIIYDISYDLRGAILSRVVDEIETETNRILETYFNGELRINFSLENKDSLEVLVQKDGNQCSFRQLSGGQRCLLKLAFGLALMKSAENKAGIKIQTLMFDEVLNGLDDTLKIKAYRLLEELSTQYDTILLIDHSEDLKNMFTNRYEVVQNDNYSRLVRNA